MAEGVNKLPPPKSHTAGQQVHDKLLYVTSHRECKSKPPLTYHLTPS